MSKRGGSAPVAARRGKARGEFNAAPEKSARRSRVTAGSNQYARRAKATRRREETRTRRQRRRWRRRRSARAAELSVGRTLASGILACVGSTGEKERKREKHTHVHPHVKRGHGDRQPRKVE